MLIPAFYALLPGVGLADYWHDHTRCFIAQSIAQADRIPGHSDRMRCPYCVLLDVSLRSTAKP
jgi:hypothetical protein